MAILKIARMGHPILRQPAEPVTDPTESATRELVRNMIETMQDAGGVGLAAPQIYVSKRLIIFHVPEMRAAAGDDAAPGESVPLTVVINPTITPLDSQIEEDWEGCLSIPEMRGLVPRYHRIRYSGLDLEGKEVSAEATGFHARVVQHECDHLDGILYPERMRDIKSLVFTSEWAHAIAADEKGQNQP